MSEPTSDCPFDWECDAVGCATVDRWDGKQTDGSDSDFVRADGKLASRLPFNSHVLDEEIYFGKYRGQCWRDVPYDYLVWCQENLAGKKWKRTQRKIQEVLNAMGGRS